MASIQKDIIIDARPEDVWDALRDFGALHTRLVPVPGGVLIQDGTKLLGAVGVSGDTSDNDEICAVAGIEAAGLKANAG